MYYTFENYASYVDTMNIEPVCESNRISAQRNNVIVDMSKSDFWFCKIIKDGSMYSVLLLADVKKNVIYTLGGESYNICKNKKQCKNNGELYDFFMRKIGKMCKKAVDDEGHYFSQIDGFADPAPNNILQIAKRFGDSL